MKMILMMALAGGVVFASTAQASLPPPHELTMVVKNTERYVEMPLRVLKKTSRYGDCLLTNGVVILPCDLGQD